jgi:hypothetical protein
MCDQVREAIARQLAAAPAPRTWSSPGPGAATASPRGARTPLSNNLRRLCKAAVKADGADLANLDLRGRS